MKTDLSFPQADEKKAPAGWPLWLWILVRMVVKVEHRTELMNPDQRSKTARVLAEKLTDARLSENKWRARCISAEKLVSYELPKAWKEAAERHDQEFRTSISWRI